MRGKLGGAGGITFGVALSVLLGWLAIRGLDWGAVAASLRNASPTLLGVSLAVFLFAGYLRALRWRILLGNAKVSSARLFIIQNEGIGLNNLMPIRGASEITQLAIISLRDGVDRATALASLGIERVNDVVASTLILVVAFLLIPELKGFTHLVWGALGLAVLVVAAVRLFAWGSGRLSFARRVAFLSALADAVRSIERERLRLLASFVVSVVYWLLVGVTAWTIARAIGLPMSPITATLVIMATIFFATVVPAAPSAVGTFEWAVVNALAIFGIERSVGFGYAVFIHAIYFMPSTVIAAVFLPGEGVISLRRIGRPGSTVVGSGSSGD